LSRDAFVVAVGTPVFAIASGLEARATTIGGASGQVSFDTMLAIEFQARDLKEGNYYAR
jgi:hypothetical protein